MFLSTFSCDFFVHGTHVCVYTHAHTHALTHKHSLLWVWVCSEIHQSFIFVVVAEGFVLFCFVTGFLCVTALRALGLAL